MGLIFRAKRISLAQKKAKSLTATDLKWQGKKGNILFMRGNINRNLPKNVPY